MMPSSIRVGFRDYRVLDWDPREANVAGRLGECDRQNGVIRVRSDLSAQMRAGVLWHEVLHAVYDMGDLAADNEEKVVTIMANQTLQVWRDNPDLVAYISECLV